MTAIDLDAGPPRTDPAASKWPWAAAATAALVAAMLAGVLIGQHRTDPHTGARPEVKAWALSKPDTGPIGVDTSAFLPTVTAYYGDGTTGEAWSALDEPWMPDRPLRMLIVVGGEACSITIDGSLTVLERAPTYRVAVCVWTAPP